MWSKPKEVDDVTLAFPARVCGTLLPLMGEIPEQFHRHNGTRWNELASKWFMFGLPRESELYCRDGVDGNKALRHLGACLGSFEPAHEHKEAGVAYLMSLFFVRVEIKGEVYET